MRGLNERVCTKTPAAAIQMVAGVVFVSYSIIKAQPLLKVTTIEKPEP